MADKPFGEAIELKFVEETIVDWKIDHGEPCPDCGGAAFHHMGYYRLACNSCAATGRKPTEQRS